MEGNETGSNEQVSRNSVLLRLVASPCSSKRVRPRIFRNFIRFQRFLPLGLLTFLARQRVLSYLSSFRDSRISSIEGSMRDIIGEYVRSINFSTVYGGEEGWLFGLIRKEVASFGPGSSRRR